VRAQGVVALDGASHARQIAARHLQELAALLGRIDVDAIARVAGVMAAARDRRAMIYLAGNGGSAATASHWTNDLGKAARRGGRPPIRVMNLSDNVPWMTALANDEGYERVFSGQLENFAQAGDVLVAISASGNSPNVLRAADLARARGLTTIGLVGFEGGQLRGMVDECVWVQTPLGAYGLVEDVHAAICHILTDSLAAAEPASPRSE
jgi:D-sedoheptulose 7-phosphate isomerase